MFRFRHRIRSVRSRTQRILGWVAVMAVLTLPFWLAKNSRATIRLRRDRISSVSGFAGLTGRSVLQLPAGLCVVLHVPPGSATASEFASVIEGDPNTVEDDGQVIGLDLALKGSTMEFAPTHLSTFNCATFALGEPAGLKLDDWIEPNPSEATFGSNPAEVLLQSYFELISSVPISPGSWTAQRFDVPLQAGDVLAFVGVVSGQVVGYFHFGKVDFSNGKLLLVSKVGQGPIVQAPLENYLSEYGNQANYLYVYRRTE